ncbi:DUF7344 domain-containing protein [Haloferacaceae archaeon DSL9]
MTRNVERTESYDDPLAVLSNRRRRYALRCLCRYQNPLPLADVAEEVAALEYDERVAEMSPETLKRVYMSLYHTHLPKMVEANLVEYDQERDSVALVGSPPRLERRLDDLDEVVSFLEARDSHRT